MRVVGAILGTLAILIVAAVLFVYSGLFDPAATDPHNPIVRWALDTTMSRSVSVRADEIAVPPLTDTAMIQKGGRHFRDACEICHGAPGVARSEMAQGLLPRPPDLAESVGRWTPAELFWIIKHGLKMTAMPAWGPSHGDDELWAIVAFLERLPDLSSEEYRAVVQRAQEAPSHDMGTGGQQP